MAELVGAPALPAGTAVPIPRAGSGIRVRARGRHSAERTILYLVLIVGAVVFAYPFIWMILTSLKTPRGVDRSALSLLPHPFDWGDYAQAVREFPFVQGLTNTLIIAAGVLVGTLVSVTLAAYAFARMKFRFRNALFYLCLTTMMIPYQVIFLPQYIMFRTLGWLGTFLPLIVPAWFAGGASGAFFIFMLRQFFLSIPRDCDEAAMQDGCGRLRVLWYILLPQMRPALVVVGLFSFLGTWNDVFGPLIYLTRSSSYTLALDYEVWAQSQPIASGAGVQQYPFDRIMAVATIITLVPIALFFVAQRYFRRGIVIGAATE